MFSSLISRLHVDIGATKDVVELHEYARGLFYLDPPKAHGLGEVGDPWHDIRKRNPGKTKWQVYDHCASLTRLYAVYSIFVDELVSEYLRVLPELYETYDQLPESILNQHRIGFGQILLKLGDTGPYRHLRESDIISQLSHGLSGGRPYSLLNDAFFVDRQNYRSDVLGKLLGYLGVINVCSKIATHPNMKAFLSERIGDAATFESELNGFIKLRNEAAHGQVGQVVGVGQFLAIADFLVLLCEILAEMLTRELHTRKAILGQFVELGVVKEVHYSGKVAIVKMKQIAIAAGEEIVLFRGGNPRFGRIESLQLDGIASNQVAAQDGQELGVALTYKCKVGDLLGRIGSAVAEQPTLFNPEELQTGVAVMPEVDDSRILDEAQSHDAADEEESGAPR
jgi:hypothetical protein